MPELPEKSRRPRLDELLQYKFQLTEQDVQQKIQQLQVERKNFQDPIWVQSEVDKQVDKRREAIQRLLSDVPTHWPVLSSYLMAGFLDDQKTWREFSQTKNPALVTKEVIETSLMDFKESLEEHVNGRNASNERAVRFADEHGAHQIFTAWVQVWNCIQSITPPPTDDSQIYPIVKEKFPEFCENIGEYIVFVRAMPWNDAAEHLILQKEVARKLREGFKKKEKLV